jgi:Flp pilus assembly pilin Flp
MREQSQDGASAVEYSLLAALIAAVIFGSVLVLGQAGRDSLQDSCTRITVAMGTGCGP